MCLTELIMRKYYGYYEILLVSVWILCNIHQTNANCKEAGKSPFFKGPPFVEQINMEKGNIEFAPIALLFAISS